MTVTRLVSASEALAKRLAEDPELAALVEAERDVLLLENKRLEALFQRTCGCHHSWVARAQEANALRAEVERLKQSMVDHFKNEHLAGDGPEIDRWKAEVAKLRADEQWLAMGRDYREHRLLRACQSLHKRWKTVQNEAHKPCTCGTDTNPDICVCPKCLDAWIVGNGAEFLDRVTAGLRKKAVSWCRLLDACQSLHKRWKESRTGSGR